jgi:hypothetical protein
MTTQQRRALTVTGALVALILLHARSTDAAYERLAATTCQVSDPTDLHSYSGTWGTELRNFGTSPLDLVCPIPSNTDMPHTGITGVTVKGFDGCDNASCGVTARVCASYSVNANGVGAGCGTSSTVASNDSYFSLSVPNLTGLDDLSETPYLYLQVPQVDTSYSDVRSILFVNTSPIGGAGSYSERVSAASCQPVTPANAHAYKLAVDQGMTFENRNSSATSAEVICPIPDKSKLEKATIAHLYAYTYDGNNDSSRPTTARTCYIRGDGQFGACGTPASSNGTCGGTTYSGACTLYVPVTSTSFGGQDDTGYVWVTVPKPDGASISSLNGLRFIR